jgi:hypothetical protein
LPMSWYLAVAATRGHVCEKSNRKLRVGTMDVALVNLRGRP